MTNRAIFLLAVMALAFAGQAFFASPALATRDPRPMKIDHRVRTVMYQPDAVFRFTGHYGYQSAIEFAPDETIETITMGDSTAWMVNPLGNRLFLKPVEQDATTNMTLLTNKRSYLMELHARETTDIDDEEMVFIMRFIYSGADDITTITKALDQVPLPNVELEPEKYNFNYTISGSEDVAPIRIFDDGEFTYFEFRGKNTEVPAFYVVDSEGNEAMINYRTRGNFIVVERVGRRFTLRHGNEVVCVFNEAWPFAPKPQ